MSQLVETPPAGDTRPPSPGPLLAGIYDAASRCNKCSLCQAVCPTYVVNPVEWETARGRVSLIRDVVEGRLDLADIADGPLSTCLTCDNCVAACAPQVPTADIVTAARAELAARQGLSLGQRLALRALLPHPTVLRAVHRLGRVAEALELLPLARRTGLTGWLGVVGSLAEHVGPLPRSTARDQLRSLPPPSGELRGRLGMIVCCYENIALPDPAVATVRLFAAEGWEVVVPEIGCLGLPARTYGDHESVLDMAVRVAETLADVDVDYWVGDVASCLGHLRRYGELLSGDRLAPVARRLAARSRFVSGFLGEVGLRSPLGPLRWTVAYHEPCSLPLDPGARRAPYRLLESVPGLRLVPLEEAAMCCGGPGTYFHAQAERSAAILERKMAHLCATGAEVVVTENVSCLLQLRRGARLFAPQLRVLHLAEVLLAAVDAERQRHPVVPRD